MSTYIVSHGMVDHYGKCEHCLDLSHTRFKQSPPKMILLPPKASGPVKINFVDVISLFLRN